MCVIDTTKQTQLTWIGCSIDKVHTCTHTTSLSHTCLTQISSFDDSINVQNQSVLGVPNCYNCSGPKDNPRPLSLLIRNSHL